MEFGETEEQGLPGWDDGLVIGVLSFHKTAGQYHGPDCKPCQVLREANGEVGILTIAEHACPDLTVGFNTNFLLDALETMPGEVCDVYMDSPLAPCVFTTTTQPNFLHLVMPIKV